MSMESKDRVIAALNHREPDRVPFDFGGNPNAGIHNIAYRRLLELLGIEAKIKIDEIITQQAKIHEEVLQKLHVDVRKLDYPVAGVSEYRIREEGKYTTFIDSYGIKWAKPKQGGLYFDMISHPLSGSISEEQISTLTMPSLPDKERLKALKVKAKNFSEAGYAVLVPEPGGGIFELASWIRGFEDIFLDIAGNSTLLERLLDRLVEYRLSYWRLILEEMGEYVDIIAEADDVATQSGMMISPKAFRSILKPRYRVIFSFIKRKAKKPVYICFHSCGAIREIIPDLIDVGVDAINPVQVSAADMDTNSLKSDFGRDITFWGGGVDTQKILPRGTTVEVKEEVKRRITDLAPGGGFIFAAVHNIQADVPPENIMAMWESLMEYGKY
ncbi:MAG: hypothetical protein DRP87_14195 [Spirochaetes bacterium]|nr:MAG: hypothetical protein DRP87_14195 [Spirochaetota bacterium]